MRILGDESALATGASPTSPISGSPSGSGGSPSAQSSDAGSPAATVDFSSQAQQIQNAKAAVDAVPDVREDLVSSLKQQVDAGTYHVSSSDIADMMMRRQSADQMK